jgi:hypothetical protein
MKKTNRYRHTPDLGADLAGMAITLALLASVTLGSLFIYTWWKPQGPIARLFSVDPVISVRGNP